MSDLLICCMRFRGYALGVTFPPPSAHKFPLGPPPPPEKNSLSVHVTYSDLKIIKTCFNQFFKSYLIENGSHITWRLLHCMISTIAYKTFNFSFETLD